MWFPYSWKLVDVDTAVEKGESSPLNYTPMYVSPEIIQAKEAGKSEIIPEASVDMWSFGIVAFEVLTGWYTVLYGSSGLLCNREAVLWSTGNSSIRKGVSMLKEGIADHCLY